MTATRAVAWPDDMLTPWERAKKERLLRREADPEVSRRVLAREQERLRAANPEASLSDVFRDRARG